VITRDSLLAQRVSVDVIYPTLVSLERAATVSTFSFLVVRKPVRHEDTFSSQQSL